MTPTQGEAEQRWRDERYIRDAATSFAGAIHRLLKRARTADSESGAILDERWYASYQIEEFLFKTLTYPGLPKLAYYLVEEDDFGHRRDRIRECVQAFLASLDAQEERYAIERKIRKMTENQTGMTPAEKETADRMAAKLRTTIPKES